MLRAKSVRRPDLQHDANSQRPHNGAHGDRNGVGDAPPFKSTAPHETRRLAISIDRVRRPF